jgi:beta-glucosidase
MMGDYSFPMHIGPRFPDLPLGISVPTIRDVLVADSAGYEVIFSQGCPVLGGDDGGIALAAAAARSAEFCIAVLGDRAGLFGAGTSGEGCDATDLRLPGRQEELLGALLGTGVPVVLVLLVGRPYDISAFGGRLAAIVCGFFPGEEGAGAVADALSGRVSPSGRLPVSFPSRGGGQPGTYLGPRLAHTNQVTVVDPTPLFPFGHGLSYHPASWVSVEAASAEDWSTDGVWEIAVTLHNPHGTPTSEVVQVYLQDPVAEVARPERQLVAVKRVDLAPGATSRIVFALHADLTSYTGLAGCRQVDPGEVRLLVGASSVDIKGSLTARLSGPRRDVGYDRVLHPVVSVS